MAYTSSAYDGPQSSKNMQSEQMKEWEFSEDSHDENDIDLAKQKELDFEKKTNSFKMGDLKTKFSTANGQSMADDKKDYSQEAISDRGGKASTETKETLPSTVKSAIKYRQAPALTQSMASQSSMSSVSKKPKIVFGFGPETESLRRGSSSNKHKQLQSQGTVHTMSLKKAIHASSSAGSLHFAAVSTNQSGSSGYKQRRGQFGAGSSNQRSDKFLKSQKSLPYPNSRTYCENYVNMDSLANKKNKNVSKSKLLATKKSPLRKKQKATVVKEQTLKSKKDDAEVARSRSPPQKPQETKISMFAYATTKQFYPLRKSPRQSPSPLLYQYDKTLSKRPNERKAVLWENMQRTNLR